MRLSFLRDASDRVELENREVDSEILKAMENTAPVAIGGKWDEKLEHVFITNIGRYRRYKYDSIRDLLRVIRNKLNHYRELPPEIQVCLIIVSLKHRYTVELTLVILKLDVLGTCWNGSRRIRRVLCYSVSEIAH